MPPPGRLSSLDAFRGLTIAAMILVNHPGNWMAVFPQLQHAEWDGCTFADLVFPFFLVIMGMAIPVAFARRRESQATTATVYRRIAWRSAGLFGLGFLLNLLLVWPALQDARVPGVLQRIAVTYAVAAPLVLHFGAATWAGIAAGLVTLHWGLLTLVPINGVAGLVTPGHNLAATVDQAIFGAHLLPTPTDPEGLLGTLPSIAIALLGAVAGAWIASGDRRGSRRVAGLAIACVVLGLIWARVWPLNKTLWSGSYALFATGLALLTYAAIAVVVQSWPPARRVLAPFVWLGTRPLTIYFWSELVGQALDRPLVGPQRTLGVHDFLFWRGVTRLFGDNGGRWSSLVFAAAYALVWIGVAYLLRRREVTMQA